VKLTGVEIAALVQDVSSKFIDCSGPGSCLRQTYQLRDVVTLHALSLAFHRDIANAVTSPARKRS
jgi:hypothetical protein